MQNPKGHSTSFLMGSLYGRAWRAFCCHMGSLRWVLFLSQAGTQAPAFSLIDRSASRLVHGYGIQKRSHICRKKSWRLNTYSRWSQQSLSSSIGIMTGKTRAFQAMPKGLHQQQLAKQPSHLE